MELSKCCYCKQTPDIVRLPGDLFYVQCTCGKHGLYDYIGITEKLAIESWNLSQSSKAHYLKGENE